MFANSIPTLREMLRIISKQKVLIKSSLEPQTLQKLLSNESIKSQNCKMTATANLHLIFLYLSSQLFVIETPQIHYFFLPFTILCTEAVRITRPTLASGLAFPGIWKIRTNGESI